MNKFLVKLELSKKSVPQKVEFGDHVIDEMTANANFPTSNPDLLVMQGATDDLRSAASAAESGGLLLTAEMHEKEAIFDTLMTALGNYVDNIAQGSETIILSAGMETKKAKESATVQQVTGLAARISLKTGVILLEWDKLAGIRVYAVFMRKDSEPDSAYTAVAGPSTKKFVMTGLDPGVRYWFKVEAVYSGNRIGAFSDPATAVAGF